MTPVDVRSTQIQLRQLAKEAQRLYDQWQAKEREIANLEGLLDRWKLYQALVKQWRADYGRKASIPATQYCVIDGNPILSYQTARTCSSWCRQAAYRKRKAASQSETFCAEATLAQEVAPT